MAEIIGYIGRAQTLSAELSTPQTITGSLCGGASHGIPAGGEPGQGLIKVSDTDYDVKWMSILPEDTASGAVASFPDGADDLPMGVVVDIDPVQDLHGYDNPWPGGGGKNLYNADALNVLSNNGITVTVNNGTITMNGTATANAFFSVANTGYAQGDYVFSFNNPVANANVHCSFRTTGGTYFSDTSANAINKTQTITGEPNSILLYVASGTTLTNFVVKPQLELGSTATSYAPYSNICPISGWTKATISHSGADTSNPTEYEIPFSTEVYGGKLNVETGELVVTNTFDDLGTLNWTKSSSMEGAFYATLSKQYPGNSSNIMLCDGYGFDGARSTSPYYPDNGKYTYFPSPSVREVYFRNTSFSSAADFKASVNGMKIVYPLATPITLTLDPVEIRSLLGHNNVWADTGDVSVTYKADIQKYIDKKISAAVAAMS